MALVSILLAVLAFGCTVIGFLTTPIPVVGLVFSFGAATIALGGIMLGGRAISQAKRQALPMDAARIAVVLNVVAFIPALLVAFTCGVCNAIVSTGDVHVQKGVDFGFGPKGFPAFDSDAGAAALPPPPRGPGVPGTDSGMQPAQTEPGSTQPQPNPAGQPQPEPGSPPGLPPPPLPAGPRK
jgi:hypothetical protein